MNIEKEIYLTKQELSLTLEENILLKMFEANPTVYSILVKYNAFLVGGALTSLFSHATINDLDIYFSTEDDFLHCNEELSKHYRPFIKTNNATTYRHLTPVPIQLIKTVIKPTIQEIFNEFDFTVCMAGYSFAKKEFVFHHDFFKHLSQRMLVFNTNSKHVFHALLRVEKYKKRGYSFSRKELYKIIGCIIALKIETNEDLISLLQGMYGVENKKVINKLKEPELLKEQFNLATFLQIVEDSFYPVAAGLVYSPETEFAAVPLITITEPLPF